MNFMCILHDGRYRSKVFLSAIPKLEHGFEVKVTDLDFSYKCQSFCLYRKDRLISLVFVAMIVIGLKFYLASSLHPSLTFEVTDMGFT